MSLIVTAYTQEGIVIGADSCITTNFTQEGKELNIAIVGINYSC